MPSRLNGIQHLRRTVKRHSLAEGGKSSDTSRRAFDVRVVNHNIPEHLGWVHELIPAVAMGELYTEEKL